MAKKIITANRVANGGFTVAAGAFTVAMAAGSYANAKLALEAVAEGDVLGAISRAGSAGLCVAGTVIGARVARQLALDTYYDRV